MISAESPSCLLYDILFYLLYDILLKTSVGTLIFQIVKLYQAGW